MKVDILAIGAHPDDVELSCAGTLIKHIKKGKTVALVDLTQGELGTRGSGPLRLKEAEASRKVMGAVARENLGLADGFFQKDKASLLKVIEMIRKYQPEIVLANALSDRHIDHGKGADLVHDACFLSGLRKIETFTSDGQEQGPWRPKVVYHYIQDHQLHPDIVVDITEEVDAKIECIKCFGSQFYDPNSPDPPSPISGKDFFDYIKSKNKVFGRSIMAEYGEGFNVSRPVGVEDLTSLI